MKIMAVFPHLEVDAARRASSPVATNEQEGNPMSKETVVRMRVLNSHDSARVSTVLEEMFQFFDSPLRRHPLYKAIKKKIRLRLALMVFGDSGYARLDETVRPTPMMVPTANLLELLQVTKPTTNLQPLVLPPVGQSISQQKANLHRRYTLAFEQVMANRMAEFLRRPAAMLQMEEMGHILQSRAPNGDLVWSRSKKGEGFYRRQAAVNAEAVARRTPGITNGLELEVEMDSENILLLRGDDLPIESELAASLDITNLELVDLFETATKLLAEADPASGMRAYAAQDANGDWQVTLLPP